MTFPFRNMRDVLGLHAKVSSRKTAVISFDADFNRRDLSYLEFVGKTHQVANFLYEDLNIQRGETIALISPNHENALLLMFATWVIGAAVVVIDADASTDTISHILQQTGAKVVFADHRLLSETAPVVAEVPGVDGVIQIGGKRHDHYLRFEDLAANRPTTFLGDESGAKGADIPMTGGNERTARLTDIALIIYQHDTLIKRTQGDMLQSATQFAQLTALTGNQHAITTLSLHHHFDQAILAPLVAGATLSLFEQFSPDHFWHTLAQDRGHTALLTTDHLAQMLTVAQEHIAAGKMRFGGKIIQQDVKHFRHMTVLDRAITKQIAQEFEDVFGISLLTGAIHPQTGDLLTLMPITLAWTYHQQWLHGYDAVSVGTAVVPLTFAGNTIMRVLPDGTQQSTGLTGYAKQNNAGQQFIYLSE